MPLPTDHADLEALAWAQTAQINSLSNLNQILTAQISRQEDLIAEYKAHASTPTSTSPSTTVYTPTQTSIFSTSPSRQPSPVLRSRYETQPPERQTTFYLDSRNAGQLQLSFIIPGFNGESLPFKMNVVDLAFVLERTLERRGWREKMMRKGIDNFLEKPMVEVKWLGSAGEIGRLN